MTESHKKFLDKQKPKATPDKFEELIHIGRFILASNLNLEIVVPEKPIIYPDFLVKYNKINIGIEHTRLMDPIAKSRIKIFNKLSRIQVNI